jgi:hypothetical protein
MRFLIDECLHESLVGVAHAAGYEATHVNHLGLAASPTERWPSESLQMSLLSSQTTAWISFNSSEEWICILA